MALRLTRANSEYLSITTGIFDHNANYTVAGWLYIVSGSVNQGIFHVGRVADYVDGDVVHFNTAELPRINVDIGGSSVASTGSSLSTGTWYHVAIVRSSASVLTVYVDQVSAVSVTNNVTGRTAAGQITIGENTGYADQRFWGWKAWTRALTTAELTAESKQAMPVSSLSLYGVWPFLAGATRAKDFSGKGHDWTEVNTPTDEDPPPVRFRKPEPLLFWPPAAASGAISGSATGAATVAGSLTGSGALASSIAAAATLTAALIAAGAMGGSSTGSATVTGALTGAGAVSASVTGQATVTGALGGPGSISGAVSAAATVTGALTGAGALAGSVTGAATVTGTLGGGSSYASIVGLATVAGALTGTGALAASTTGTATVTAAIGGALPAAASITGTATLTAALLGLVPIAASISGAATTTGALLGAGALTAAIAGTATVTGATHETGTRFASTTGTATVAGAITGRSALVAAAVGTAIVTGSLVSGSISAAISGSASASVTTAVLGVVVDTSETTENVVLQKDFVNVVGSATGGYVEVQITRDADGRMRFWSAP